MKLKFSGMNDAFRTIVGIYPMMGDFPARGDENSLRKLGMKKTK